MTVKKVDEQTLNSWVGELARATKVFAPQARDDWFVFDELKSASDIRLDYDVTVIPPKKFLQPPSERLLRFEKTQGYETVLPEDKFVILGVHPYDLVAINQMDRIFAQDNPDVHYMKLRENATIVAVDVQQASENVFAGYMGTSHVEDGYDVLLTKVDGSYVVDAATAKGEAILGSLASAADAAPDDLKAREGVWRDSGSNLRKHELKAEPSQWPGLLNKAYDHPVWAEKAERCFSCGSCTMVCPTCYCFDVREDVEWSMDKGDRCRFWDSCQLKDFATVAGNHNFRKDRAARYRHRYYRKGAYVPGKIDGEIACVGCGRCITACVANIANPVEVINRLTEEG